MQITSMKMVVILLALNLLMLTDIGGVILTICLISVIGIPIGLGLMALPSMTAFYAAIFIVEHVGGWNVSRKQIMGLALLSIIAAIAIGQFSGHLAFLPHIALERMMSSGTQFNWWVNPL